MTKYVVIGAGIIGLATAKSIARRVISASIRLRAFRSYTSTLRVFSPFLPSRMCGVGATLGSNPAEEVHGLTEVELGMPYHSSNPWLVG